jgi:hypothetical protein
MTPEASCGTRLPPLPRRKRSAETTLAPAGAGKNSKNAAEDDQNAWTRNSRTSWITISSWSKEDDKSEKSDFSLSHVKQEDGLVLVEASKGSFEYRLKPLQELFSPALSGSKTLTTDDPRYLNLLYAIESSIKRLSMENPELTDASVILALDALAVRPEALTSDGVVKRINRDLRLLLSMSEYSRDEVKTAARKILASVKRHRAAAGARGYLDFIEEQVP